MKARILNIYGENRFEEHTRLRQASRGILISGGKLLLTYEVNTDQWFIPGGGMEPGESPEQCCVRELAEETGCLVETREHFLTINEFYEEWLFVSYYFLCEQTGEGSTLLTEREKEVGLEARWVDFDKAVEIFSRHQDYAEENEMKRGAYLREYEALRALVERE